MDQATGKFVAIEIVTTGSSLPEPIFGHFRNANMPLLKVIIVPTSNLGENFNRYRERQKKLYNLDIELKDPDTFINRGDISTKEAFENHKAIIKTNQKETERYFKLARQLKESRDKSYYEALGYNSFTEYLAIPEISMSQAQASKLIANYEVWAGEGDYKEWLERARTLPRAQLIIEVNEAKATDK